MKFKEALNATLSIEQGYIDDKFDPGGETKYGICKRSYPHLDIKNLTLDEVCKIYEKDYWKLAHCEEVAEPLKLCMFDTAVHSGIKPAIIILQRALGLEDDGIWGPKTAKAAAGKVSAETVAMYWAKRALYMADMKNFDRNKNGWYKRLFMLAVINH